jgi:hypothetical protein
MLASQEARPSIRPDALGPPGGAANYAPRDIGALARGIESPMFNPPQSTPQFPATGWAGAPGAPPSPSPQLGPTIAAANAAFGGGIPTIGAATAAPPATTQREVPDEQRKAELQKAITERIEDMRTGAAPPTAVMAAAAGQPPPDFGLGQTTIGTANDPFPNFPTPGLTSVGDRANEPRPSQYEAPTGAFLGDIPTVAPPPMESIVQPQIDQGGQGLLGGQGLGDQTPVEGPAAGRSDAQGVLDAISQADFTGVNQQDQQPGGDQGATASAASGDNPFTSAQTAEQQGILAMLEEMFGSGSTR